MLILLGVGLGGGAAFGALTNSVNGAICPEYFREVMDWGGEDIWLRAIGHGALEGAIRGLAYAAIFIVLIALISGRRCDLTTAMRYAALTFLLSFIFWLVGGLVPIGVAILIPRLQHHPFFGYPATWGTLAFYGWVHGSILGAVNGGLSSVLLTNAIYALRSRSRRLDLEAWQSGNMT